MMSNNVTFDYNGGVNPELVVWDISRVALCADLHLGHDKDFIYANRGFSHVGAHDRFIVGDLWAADNGITDIICLGDAGWDIAADLYYEYWSGLSSKKFWLVPGNHDVQDKLLKLDYLTIVPNMTMCKFNVGQSVDRPIFTPKMILSHMPLLTHDFTHYVNLCGHCHGALSDINIKMTKWCYDLGVNTCLTFTKGKHCYVKYSDIKRLIDKG